MFVRMLKLPEAERARYDLSSLRVAIHAAAPCPIPVKEQMIDVVGPDALRVLRAAPRATASAPSTRTSGSRTRARSAARCSARAAHPRRRRATSCRPATPGAIYFEGGADVRVPQRPGEDARRRATPQGWSTLGDIGYLDADGYLYLTDRKANMIISGGVNIYPQEAENLLVDASEGRRRRRLRRARTRTSARR